MNTNFRRFKTLSLRIMAVSKLTSMMQRQFLEDFMTFCMCVSLYDGNKHCVEHKDC